VTPSSGTGVTSTDLVVVNGVARSALSDMRVLVVSVFVVSDPLAVDETSTVALIVPSVVLAAMGSEPEYVQVSTVLLLLSAQLQPVPEPAAEYVSPEGNVEVTVGSFSAGPPVELIEGLTVSV
jgi:hypothetical protein